MSKISVLELKKIQLILGLVLYSLLINAQSTFQKTFGTKLNQYGHFMQQTVDSGFVIIGPSLITGTGTSDVYLVKTDSNGDTLWTRLFYGNSDEHGYCVQQTFDEGYILTGQTVSFGSGWYDLYIIRTDNFGNEIWSKTFGGANGETGFSCLQTPDGGYIIAGQTASYGAGFSDFYLLKLDSIGNFIWSKAYGGNDYEQAYCIKKTIDGGYILVGYTTSFGLGNADVLLVKTDSQGNLTWSKTYGNSNENVAYSVIQTSDNGYIVIGFTRNISPLNDDIYLIKTNSIGDTLWTKSIGTQSNNTERGRFISQTPDSGYILTGELLTSQAFLLKLDVYGDTLWAKYYGAQYFEAGYCALPTIDGGIIMTGQYNVTVPGPHVTTVYLVKSDSLGNSGCLEGIPNLYVMPSSTQVTYPSLTITSITPVVNTANTLSSSGSNVVNLCNPVGIDELDSDYPFKVIPNPTSGNFIISFNKMIEYGKVEILNTLGETIFNENIHSETESIPLVMRVSQGIYIVKVYFGEQMFSQKIIIQTQD